MNETGMPAGGPPYRRPQTADTRHARTHRAAVDAATSSLSDVVGAQVAAQTPAPNGPAGRDAATFDADVCAATCALTTSLSEDVAASTATL